MTDGPFFLSLVDEDDMFGPDDEVEAFEVFDAIVTHKEFEWALLEVTISNPYVGLLAPGRKQWAYMAWRDPANPSADPVVLFKGRLISIPDDLQSTTITLNIEARSSDFEAQKATLADTLKAAGFWDPLFIDEIERSNPDSALEARTQVWHIGRVDHVVSVSDIVNGEDGTVTFDGSNIFDLSMTFGDVPVSEVTVNAEAYWDQKAMGIVDLNGALVAASRVAGGDDLLVSTYTGQGLASRWPQKGTNIGGDWSVDESSIYPADGISVQRVTTETTVGGISITETQAVVVGFRKWRFTTAFSVLYDTERQYKETITFTLRAGVQAVVTDPGDSDKLPINLGSGDVAALIDEVGTHFEMPIGDVRRRAYFTTDRGKRTVEWLIALARAQLIKRARCVYITVTIPFEDAIGLSCRKNATITDDRLPGGTATGKIIGYSFGIQGGKMTGEATIACLVGSGGSVSEVPGEPTYVEEGYVESGYQQYEGGTTAVAGEVTYGSYAVPPNDDGVNLFQMTPVNVIQSLTLVNGVTAQKAVIQDDTHRTPQEVADKLNAVASEFRLVLVPLNTGPFETAYTVPVSDLVIARQINLEAA